MKQTYIVKNLKYLLKEKVFPFVGAAIVFVLLFASMIVAVFNIRTPFDDLLLYQKASVALWEAIAVIIIIAVTASCVYAAVLFVKKLIYSDIEEEEKKEPDR